MNQEEKTLRRYMAQSARDAAEELEKNAQANSGAANLTRELTTRIRTILNATADFVNAGRPDVVVDLVLVEVGQKKIQIIKELRNLFPLGLKEAKEVMDLAPTTVAEQLDPQEAQEAASALRQHGAKVELR